MAIETLPYGVTEASTPLEVRKERATATQNNLDRKVVDNDVSRVNFGDRTIEVAKLDHRAMGRPVDKQYEKNRASIESRLNAIGVATATVISFLPIPLRSDSCLQPLKTALIKPPKDGEEFSAFYFTDAFIEPTRQGADSPLIGVDWHPIQLAMEFSKLNPQGVMAFIGIPSDVYRKEWREKKSTETQHNGRTYGQVFDQTRAAAIAWMQKRLEHGGEQERLKQLINEPSKLSALRLKHLGIIKELPQWVHKRIDPNVRVPICPKCQNPSEPHAVECTKCHYIIDPKRAYEIEAIVESDLSLERLTRAEVEALGISAYVAETRDEKPARLAAGLPKPASRAAQLMMQTEEQIASDKAEIDAKFTGASIGTAIAKAIKEK